jgi:hypothetical protein
MTTKSGDANKARIKAQNKTQMQIKQRSRQNTIRSGLKSHNLLGANKTNVSLLTLTV